MLSFTMVMTEVFSQNVNKNILIQVANRITEMKQTVQLLTVFISERNPAGTLRASSGFACKNLQQGAISNSCLIVLGINLGAIYLMPSYLYDIVCWRKPLVAYSLS